MNGKKLLVKDKLWLFASRPHDDDPYFVGAEGINSMWSRITPTEGAHMLGVNNVIMVCSDGIPVPFSKDAYGYMESFCNMKNVMWSVTGSAGFRNGNEEEFICYLSDNYPNVMGAFYDDFTCRQEDPNGEKHSEEYLTNFLRESRKKLDKASRKIEMWTTCYVSQLDRYSEKMFDSIDGITVWSMDVNDALKLEENLSQYEKRLPGKKIMLGIYMFDYQTKKAIPEELLKTQCETGLKWLKEGRIEGIVFLTNCVMGIGLESEYFLREWIKTIGDQEL